MDASLPGPQWFCVRSQPKRQNVAAAHLRSLGIEVLNPQLRVRRSLARGPVWRTEPLFLNYVFARFELLSRFRRVRYAFGVSNLLKFGADWAVVPDREIEHLQALWGEEEAYQVPDKVEVGKAVTLTGGLFHGMNAVVLSLLPARQRVKVLLEFLGGLTEAEVEAAGVVSAPSHPLSI